MTAQPGPKVGQLESAVRGGGLVIVGAGGFAREVHALVKDLVRAGDAWEVLAFLGRPPDPIGTQLHGLPLLETLPDDLRGRVAAGVAAVGDPPARRREVEARTGEVPAWAPWSTPPSPSTPTPCSSVPGA